MRLFCMVYNVKIHQNQQHDCLKMLFVELTNCSKPTFSNWNYYVWKNSEMGNFWVSFHSKNAEKVYKLILTYFAKVPCNNYCLVTGVLWFKLMLSFIELTQGVWAIYELKMLNDQKENVYAPFRNDWSPKVDICFTKVMEGLSSTPSGAWSVFWW